MNESGIRAMGRLSFVRKAKPETSRTNAAMATSVPRTTATCREIGPIRRVEPCGIGRPADLVRDAAASQRQPTPPRRTRTARCPPAR